MNTPSEPCVDVHDWVISLVAGDALLMCRCRFCIGGQDGTAADGSRFLNDDNDYWFYLYGELPVNVTVETSDFSSHQGEHDHRKQPDTSIVVIPRSPSENT